MKFDNQFYATRYRDIASDHEKRASEARSRARALAQKDEPEPNVEIKPVNGLLEPIEGGTSWARP